MRAFDTYTEITDEFIAMFDDIFETNSTLRTLHVPKRCHVTTMTFVVKMSKELPITEATVDALHTFQDTDPFFTTIGICAFSKSCVEFHSIYIPSVRTKVFNKGALQITGCKSHVEAMHTISEVCRVLSAYVNEDIEALSMRIAMINLNVTLDQGVRLTQCAQAMRQRRVIAEQPERPPSCILKIPRQTRESKPTTVIVYKPGKFVICGASTPRDVSNAYKIVMNTLDETNDILERRKKDAIRRGRGHYTWSQLVHCGMPGAMHTHNPTTKTACVHGCLYCTRYGNCFSSFSLHQT